MSIVLRIGLISVWSVIVTANFEYSVNSINPLYQELQKEGDEKPDIELVNEKMKVVLGRANRDLPVGSRLIFKVLTKGFESKLNNPRPRTTSHCNEAPGLWLKSPVEETLPPKLFCYHRVNFEIMRDSEKKPVMEIIALFFNADNEEFMAFVMPVFVPPVAEADIRHAAENDVLRNVCPIPLDQFETEGLIPRMKGQEEKQYFVGDIAWLKEVLPRARRLEGKDEWYYPGPVIIEAELYKKIIGLDYMFNLHALGEEPK